MNHHIPFDEGDDSVRVSLNLQVLTVDLSWSIGIRFKVLG